MSNLKQLICVLASDFASENTAAFTLWSWLPSNKDAVAKHGDYACEFQPSLANLMTEAAIVLNYLKNGGKFEDIRTNLPKEETEGWFRCNCEDHD